MTRFRQALLDELLSRVTHPADQPAPAGPGLSRRHPRLLLAAGGLAAVAVAAALVLTQTAPTPAYAVSANADGTVTVTFNHIADPDEVNQALREAGVRAMVVLPQAPDACPVQDRGIPQPVGVHQAWSTESVLVPHGPDGVNVARLEPDQIPLGMVLILVPMDRGPAGEAGPYLRLGYYQEPGPSCVINDWR